MSARGLTSITVFAAALAGSQGIGAQDPSAGDPDPVALEARVWLDRGVDPVLRRGDRVRVYYRTAQDAFVGIFQIDTNGFVRLLFPRSPADDHYVSGGRDYRLLFPSSPYWRVDENEGKGYLFVVAATTPVGLLGLLVFAIRRRVGPELGRAKRLQRPVRRHGRFRRYGDPRLGVRGLRTRLRHVRRGPLARLPAIPVLRLPWIPAVQQLESVRLLLHELPGRGLRRPVLLPELPLQRDSGGLRASTGAAPADVRVQGAGSG